MIFFILLKLKNVSYLNYIIFFTLCSAPVTVEPPKSEEQSTPPTTEALSPVLESASSDEFERMVQNIMDMGYERTQVANSIFLFKF